MPRRNTLVAMTMLSCIVAESCQTLMGGVDVSATRQSPEPAGAPEEYTAGPIQALNPTAPVSAPAAPPPSNSVEAPITGATLEPQQPASPGLPQIDAGVAPNTDAGGTGSVVPDAGPAPFVPTAIVVDPASALLDRVGVIGGGPRLGTCAGGVAIGVLPTANPNTGIFGERLTFLELVCGKISTGPNQTLTVERDDSLPAWDTSGSFLGTPPTVVPDTRVSWVVQPATLCPEAAPVLVGVSGTLDPTAPDDTSTDAIRSLSIECAPLTLASNGVDVVAAASGHELIAQADSFATTGSDAYRSICDGGTVISQIRVDSGFWLDGFVLGCSTLHEP